MTVNVDRRRFLAKAGVGAAATGVLWVTPSVLGTSAAFAGSSCVCSDSLNWGSFSVGSSPTTQNYPASGSCPEINLSWSITQVGTFTPGADNGTVVFENDGGSTSNRLKLSFAGADAGAGDGYDLTFTFTDASSNPYQVYLPNGAVANIGSATTEGQDKVWVDSDTTVSTSHAGFSPTFTGSGTSSADPWTGNKPATGAQSNNVGTYGVTGNGSLTSTFTIHYRLGAAPTATPYSVYISILNINWCR